MILQNTDGLITRLLQGLVLIMALVPQLSAIAVAEPPLRSILIINQSGPNRPWFVAVYSALRSTLGLDPAGPINIYGEDLDLNEFASSAYEDSTIDFWRTKYRNKPVSVLLAFGSSAYDYALHAREALWPQAQVVFAAIDEATARRLNAPAGVTGNFILMNLQNMVRAARVLVPGLKEIALIGDPLDRQTFYRHLQDELPAIVAELHIIDLTGLPMDQLKRRAAGLPDDSAIVYTGIYVDGSGTSYVPADALAAVAKVANRPIVVDVDSYLGRGATGGFLLTAASVGQDAGRLVLRVLNGENASSIPVAMGGSTTPIFDWRELQRWNIDKDRLPPGSEILFQPPDVWGQYKWRIIAGIMLCVAEAVFIAMLLDNRRRLRREHAERKLAEQAAHDLSGQLINAQEEERSRLARELHDDVTQRLALLAIDAGRGESALPNSCGGEVMRAMRQGLIRLSEDVHALSYRLHPSILEDLGLIEALKTECEKFSRLVSLPVKVHAQGLPEMLSDDVTLGLYRVMQEALHNIGRHAGASQVEVSLRRLNAGLELAVRDNGAGFDLARHRRGSSLGLAGMRHRIFLLDGKLDIKSAPGQGTMVIAWVPLGEEHRESSTRAAS